MPTSPMNRTEAAWALELEALRRAGEVQWYGFESLRLVLGDRCTYTPDFVVLLADGSVRVDEVKGHWREDARVKIKAAARAFPWMQFRAVQRKARQWQVEEIKP